METERHADLDNKYTIKNMTENVNNTLSNTAIKHIQEIIAEPLTIIINQMLNTGLIADSLKISKVIPLFKKR